MTEERRNAATKLLKTEMSSREIARAIGVSISTFYRHFPAR
ncbi:TetR family transcriptional regulator [Sphingomonas paucimobilis]|uniref:TetR family transcriptional regulator n=4 Tax=Sphingomonadaceae TaxID=41297 RepID=A0A7Y2KKW0_SPHPI|nr:TetR family transcriptional regulator [Sphingomonas paucimobilis]NNG55844.1 TetR family transcriptional regulator [Sphingomonas paucimobilis]